MVLSLNTMVCHQIRTAEEAQGYLDLIDTGDDAWLDIGILGWSASVGEARIPVTPLFVAFTKLQITNTTEVIAALAAGDQLVPADLAPHPTPPCAADAPRFLERSPRGHEPGPARHSAIWARWPVCAVGKRLEVVATAPVLVGNEIRLAGGVAWRIGTGGASHTGVGVSADVSTARTSVSGFHDAPEHARGSAPVLRGDRRRVDEEERIVDLRVHVLDIDRAVREHLVVLDVQPDRVEQPVQLR